MTRLNRHQRRAMASFKANEPEHNGIRHFELTSAAYENTKASLERYHNTLSMPHREGLFFQAGVMTMMAQGRLSGRKQITLAPGLGKTEGMVGWIKALITGGHNHVGILVAASKVEELCNVYRKLIEAIPASKVGIRHEYSFDQDTADQITREKTPVDGFASVKSHNHDAQVLLVTHARIMQSKDTSYQTFNGKPRLVIYDEALVKAKATALSLNKIDVALYTVEKEHAPKLHGTLEQAMAYLRCCFAELKAAHKAAKDASTPQVIRLPEEDPETVRDFHRSIPRDRRLDHLRTLLDIAHFPLKVTNQYGGSGGLITYDVVIPEALRNVIVLDASYPVRNLLHRDNKIVPAELDPAVRKVLSPHFDLSTINLSAIKRYDSVEVKHMRVKGSRTAMTEDFDTTSVTTSGTRKENSKVCLEIADVVASLPSDQSVLIFTFLDKNGVKFKDQIKAALRAAKVDLTATVETPDGPRLRINVTTWGRETASNDWAYVDHVVLAGVIRRSRAELEGAILGQTEGDLATSVSTGEVLQADLGEVLHSIYQAIHRGRCRTMVEGQARTMTAWIMHRENTIKRPLTSIMPGLGWSRWKPKYLPLDQSKTEEVADKIVEAMTAKANTLESSKGIPLRAKQGVRDVVSIRSIRSELGMSKGQPYFVPDATWRDARALADEQLSAHWLVRGQSYVRNTGAAFGFTPE